MFQPWYRYDHHGVLSIISIFIVHDLHLSFFLEHRFAFEDHPITKNPVCQRSSSTVRSAFKIDIKINFFRFRCWHREQILRLAQNRS